MEAIFSEWKRLNSTARYCSAFYRFSGIGMEECSAP